MSDCVLCVCLRKVMSNILLLLIFLVLSVVVLFCFLFLRPVSYVPDVASFCGIFRSADLYRICKLGIF